MDEQMLNLVKIFDGTYTPRGTKSSEYNAVNERVNVTTLTANIEL